MTMNLQETRFRRSRSNRMVGGVCAGVARELRIDPNIVRIVAVLGAFVSFGLAAVAYLACWALLPEMD
ncbi:MAG TPA: PspC domain-containing protein [Mycobacteriales bacterium]|jgi:phage shock protein PspC (stress-responsive transcriptional regulator)|nr:PspC domain-containing protein [Mycobacteriales bacterium]